MLVMRQPVAWRGADCCTKLSTAGYLGLAPVFTKMIMSNDGWGQSFFASTVLQLLRRRHHRQCALIPSTRQRPSCRRIFRALDTRAVQALRRLYQLEGLLRGRLARTIRTVTFFTVSTIREKCILHKAAAAAEEPIANEDHARSGIGNPTDGAVAPNDGYVRGQ